MRENDGHDEYLSVANSRCCTLQKWPISSDQEVGRRKKNTFGHHNNTLIVKVAGLKFAAAVKSTLAVVIGSFPASLCSCLHPTCKDETFALIILFLENGSGFKIPITTLNFGGSITGKNL